MDLFLTTLQQVAILLLFIVLGYFFRKKDIITESGKKVLAKLLTFLFMPCYTAMSLSTEVSVDKLSKYGILFIAGIAIALFLIFLAIPFANSLYKDKGHRNILKYAFAIGNIGYFGYPVVGDIFGADMRANMILFCIPMTVAIYTYGYYILTQDISEQGLAKKQTLKQKLSFLWSAPMFGIYVGIALGLLSSGFNFEIPDMLNNVLEKAGMCQSVPAMLITGAVLAGVPLKKLFTSIKSYVVGIIKLFILPFITGIIFFIINLCGVHGETFTLIFKLSIIVSAMPVGMNTVVFPESSGQDSTEGAKACFISYVLALVSMPVVFMLMDVVAVGFM